MPATAQESCEARGPAGNGVPFPCARQVDISDTVPGAAEMVTPPLQTAVSAAVRVVPSGSILRVAVMPQAIFARDHQRASSVLGRLWQETQLTFQSDSKTALSRFVISSGYSPFRWNSVEASSQLAACMREHRCGHDIGDADIRCAQDQRSARAACDVEYSTWTSRCLSHPPEACFVDAATRERCVLTASAGLAHCSNAAIATEQPQCFATAIAALTACLSEQIASSEQCAATTAITQCIPIERTASEERQRCYAGADQAHDTCMAPANEAYAQCNADRFACQVQRVYGTSLPMVQLSGFVDIAPSGTLPDPVTRGMSYQAEPLSAVGSQLAFVWRPHERLEIDLWGQFVRGRSTTRDLTPFVYWGGGGTTLSFLIASFLNPTQLHSNNDYLQSGLIPGLILGVSLQGAWCTETTGMTAQSCNVAADTPMATRDLSVTPFIGVRVDAKLQFRLSLPLRWTDAFLSSTAMMPMPTQSLGFSTAPAISIVSTLPGI